MKKKKKKTWLIILIIVAVILIYFIASIMSAAKKMQVQYDYELAEIRDIQVYNSFRGNIATVDYQNVVPDVSVGLKIQEINVEKGDEVKAGDVLMVLDDASIRESIAELEVTMTTSASSNALALEEAQHTYNVYQQNLDNGTNAQIVSASQQVDAAYVNLLTAQKNYNNEVAANQRNLSGAVKSAMDGVNAAYNSLLSAELSYYDTKNSDIATDNQKEQARIAYENAQMNYNNACQSFEAAKINEDITITNLYDSLVTAQNNYLAAVDTYNITVSSAYEQLVSYGYAVERAELLQGDYVNQVKLDNLYKDLENCVIYAPCDGIITDLPYKVGDRAEIGKSVATVTDFSRLMVSINVSEYDIVGATEGCAVEVYVNAIDATYTGEVTYVDRVATVNNGVSYFGAEVQFDADDLVRAGMSCEIKVITSEKDGVISIKADAVSSMPDGTPYVLILDEGADEPREQIIEGGVSDGTYMEVISGVNEGDNICIPRPNPLLEAMQAQMQMQAEYDGVVIEE